jgi:hypothetical protein
LWGAWYIWINYDTPVNGQKENSMDAKTLIKIAESKGIGIGRNRPGEYSYWYYDEGGFHAQYFIGNWSEFVRHILSLSVGG